ncbi:retrotransposon protein, putative, ty1-copia subclass [Tanacetum coccineum]
MDMDGAVYTFKARLVAKGFTKTYGVDYEETFSPVADIRAIRILIAIAGFMTMRFGKWMSKPPSSMDIFSKKSIWCNLKEDDRDDLAEEADSGLQSHWDTDGGELVDIDSDLSSFWIRLVNLICEHLVTLLHLELKVNDIWIEGFNNFICLPFEICLCKRGLVHLSAVPFHESHHVYYSLCKVISSQCSKAMDCYVEALGWTSYEASLHCLFGADPDDQGGGGGGGEVEIIRVLGVMLLSFFLRAFLIWLDVDLNNLALMTFAEPHTSHCEPHEPCRSCLQTSVVEVFLISMGGQFLKRKLEVEVALPSYAIIGLFNQLLVTLWGI